MSFRNLLNTTADVHRLRYNASVNVFGEPLGPSDIVVFQDILCRLKHPVIRTGAGTAERDDEVSRFIESNYQCYMGSEMISGQFTPLIQGEDRLVIDGESYEVELIMVRHTQKSKHHLQLSLQKIKRESDDDN